MYWAGSGVFSGYNFIAELTSSHKIWQQVLHCWSEMKLQPSIMSKWGPEAECVELHQDLSPPVTGPLSGERTDGQRWQDISGFLWHSATHSGRNGFVLPHHWDHSLPSTDTLPMALGVNHDPAPPTDSQHHSRDCAPSVLLIFRWEGLWTPHHCMSSAQCLMIDEKSKCPRGGPHLKELPE